MADTKIKGNEKQPKEVHRQKNRMVSQVGVLPWARMPAYNPYNIFMEEYHGTHN
jgi:hypothetical protein